MQLTYRGIPYHHQFNQVQIAPSSQTGIYRGQTINLASPIKVSRLSLVSFNYRGVNYIRHITLN